ncbi:MAG: hypothetical protein ACLFUI_01420 [Halanaerobiales bacterium]
MKKIKLMVLTAILVVAVSGMVMAEDMIVKVSVSSYAEINAPESITVYVLNDSEDDTKTAQIEIRSNHSINVDVSTDAFKQAAFNNSISYSFNDFDFTPGNGKGGAMTVNSETVNPIFSVTVDDQAFMNKEGWEEISEADDYSSTVTFTISG